MNINKDLALYFIFFLIFISNISFPQQINDEVKDILISTFGKNSTIKFAKYEIEKNAATKIEKQVKQKFFDSSVYYYQIINNYKINGYALLDNVYGKSLPITFLVLFDNAGNIISSQIVKYREQYGGSVKNPQWNEQFIGKNYSSSFEVGKEINSISGATISVNSVTKGIQKLTLLIKEIIEKKKKKIISIG